jgi:ribose transport system ATP-binding protein
MNGVPREDANTAPPAVLALRISKRYPGTLALDGVDFEVRPGEIHALVGGNGSGKSTLIKILSGVVPAEPGGMIEIGPNPVPTGEWTAEHARHAGVHVVHQDLGVFPDLSVMENLTIGRGYDSRLGVVIRWHAVRSRAEKSIRQFGIDARPTTPLRGLSQSNRTLVAIARALQDEVEGQPRGLLILDEPTASLPDDEAKALLSTMRRYADEGQAILFVSHRLDEVLQNSDRVTAFRDGRVVGTWATAEMDNDMLVEAIVGTTLDRAFPDAPSPDTPGTSTAADVPRLALRGVAAGPLNGVDLEVGPGEVVGVAGLLGSGRSSLLRAVFGALPIEAGSILIDGREVAFRHSGDAVRAGVAYVPENRMGDACFPDLPVHTNISMAAIRRYWSGWRLNHRRERSTARDLMATFRVKAPSERVTIASLSGGNQQKVIMARWLGNGPSLLLLDEPTQGVDVGARAEIHELIRQAAQRGAAVLLVASDPEELAHAADRVVVLGSGRIAATLRGPQRSAALVMRAIHDNDRTARHV